jgi:hypothetical protein
MARYHVVREVWSHGDVDEIAAMGSWASAEDAHAWCGNPANAHLLAAGSEGASFRVVPPAGLADEAYAADMALRSLDADDLTAAAAGVIAGTALPVHFDALVSAFVRTAAESANTAYWTLDHDERVAHREARLVAKALARLAVAVGLRAGKDLGALLARQDGSNPSLPVQALRKLHAAGVELPPSVAAWLER